MNKVLSLFLVLFLISSCQTSHKEELSETEKWKLGWRMIASHLDQNYPLGEQQFDSLLAGGKQEVELKFLITGFEILEKLGKKDKLIKILESQDPETLQELCRKNLFAQNLKEVEACRSFPKVEVTHPELQMELIKMYVNDQAVRGNVMEDIITKYNLDRAEIKTDWGSVDGENVMRLKEIFRDFGFPSREMVGGEAMHGVFLMIQHSDGDKEWQKSQLPNIEKAVKRGDMDGQSYAYLYDRIKINGGEKQRYGTQFSNVDPTNSKVELAETEDIENLDKRRMEVGMMPIEMYKEFMLKSLKN